MTLTHDEAGTHDGTGHRPAVLLLHSTAADRRMWDPQMPVLAEADGTYIYNLLDPLGRRAAASLLILGPQRLRGRLVYSAEQRRITDLNMPYTLHSYSAALAWFW